MLTVRAVRSGFLTLALFTSGFLLIVETASAAPKAVVGSRSRVVTQPSTNVPQSLPEPEIDFGKTGVIGSRSEAFKAAPPPPCPNDWYAGATAGDNSAHNHIYVLYYGWNATNGCPSPSYAVYGHRPSHSCFAPETKIMMGDKIYRPAAGIKEGDMVWNPVLNKAVKVRKAVVGPEPLPLLDLVFENSTLRVSQRHPMIISGETITELTNKSELKKISLSTNGDIEKQSLTFGKYTLNQARNLKPGDMVLGSDKEFHKLIEVKSRPIKPDQKVFNFELEGDDNNPEDHMLLSEGIITGDFLLQRAVLRKLSIAN